MSNPRSKALEAALEALKPKPLLSHPRHLAVVRVSEALIRSVLDLRPELQIRDARFDSYTASFEILLAGDDLPLCREGEMPRALPIEQLQ